MKIAKTILVLTLCLTGAFAGGLRPIKTAFGYYLIQKTSNASKDTAIELWHINLRIALHMDTVAYINIIKTDLIKKDGSTYAIKGSTSEDCERSRQTCKFEIKNDTVKIEFIQQRVTKLDLYVKGKSELDQFTGMVVNHRLSPDDKLKETIKGKIINNKILMSILP